MKRLLITGTVALLVAGAVVSRPLSAAQQPLPPAAAATAQADDEGIPITNAKVKLVCGGCHKID